jgi:hypothetical protein
VSDHLVRTGSDFDQDPSLQIYVNPVLSLNGFDLITDQIDPKLLHVRPLYSVSEVAKVFFGRSSQWIRYFENQDTAYFNGLGEDGDIKPAFTFDGERIQFSREESGYRSYSLDVIEKMAHALTQNKRISANQLNNALMMIEGQCRIYKYL